MKGDDGLRAALAAAPVAVFAADPAGVCTVAEGLRLDDLGLGPSVVGRSLREFLLPDAALGHHLTRAMGGHAVSATVGAGDRAFDVFLRPLTDGGAA